jgi:formylglycine-generating enzyme required for sulfatase activity
MKKVVFMISLVVAVGAFAIPKAVITSIKQNWPWDSKTIVNYTLTGVEGMKYDISLKIVKGFDVFVPKSGSLRGDVKSVKPGERSMEWNPEIDGISGVSRLPEECFSIEVLDAPVTAASSAKEYLVIDLGGGATAETWPAEAVDELDPTDEQYKTTKLVLKKIRAGSFMQTSPDDEPLRKNGYESYSEVVLTNDYWIGVYELTQKQYELITGVAGASGQGAYPRHSITFSDVRGANLGRWWPRTSEVDGDSLIGKLRSKITLPDGIPAGWEFDLPTEAQWEYACRAGVDAPWNSGKQINVYTNEAGFACDDGLDAVGWYAANSGGVLHKVGLRMPNGFGLYDMHGSLWEMTLGVICTQGNTPESGIEPPGRDYPDTLKEDSFPVYGNSYRVVRGGCYKNEAVSYYVDGLPETAVAMCRAAARCRIYSSAYDHVGLRIALHYPIVKQGN